MVIFAASTVDAFGTAALLLVELADGGGLNSLGIGLEARGGHGEGRRSVSSVTEYLDGLTNGTLFADGVFKRTPPAVVGPAEE
jgi:hypothetical protein